MKFKYFGAAIFILSLFIFEKQVFAKQISNQEATRLQVFLKKRLAARLPADAKIDVKGYEESPIKGFKDGTFVVQSSRGSGEIPFLISQDGKYIVIGKPINTQEFEDTQIGDLKKGNLSLGNQQVSALMCKDSKYII